MDNRRQKARIFFAPPRIPPTFRPIHNPILPDISSMPNTLQKIGETMTHAQRARFLGEVSVCSRLLATVTLFAFLELNLENIDFKY